MRGLSLNQLGAVETIYEEECEFSSPSPAISLHSRVKDWSLKIGRETDVLIRVRGICFRLHKDRVASQSLYLKRHLTETSDLTLSPPLNITAETFAAVAEFCYNGKVRMTPANVAVIRTAAELLGMTAGDSLSHVAETRFREVVGTCNQDRERAASTVLRSCMALLPEAETTASLVSRCIEALVSVHGVSGLNDVNEMQPRDFLIVAESIGRRFENHDVLYKMVDLYFKEKKFEKVTEEERIGICNSIDCTKLSSETLIECVQNPRMSLRLVVRAVMVEHLNTRHSIALAGAQRHQLRFESNLRRRQRQQHRPMTLGDFLYRDAARRDTAKLKKVMDSTDVRIRSLEEEVRCMNRVLLREWEVKEEETERSPEENENGKVKKRERCSVSFDGRIMDAKTVKNGTFRQRVVIGLKNAFRVPNSVST